MTHKASGDGKPKRAVIADTVASGASGPAGEQRRDQPEQVAASDPESDLWGGFQRGDIVAIEGRAGEWELMAHVQMTGVWQVEPARPEDREPEEAHVSTLRRLTDAPHVHRGDLVMQSYPEQERVAEVGAVFGLGRWVAETTRTEQDGRTWSLLDDVERLVVVTREVVESALRLNVEDGEHRGRIVQTIVTRHAGRFRVTCRCLPGIEVCRKGRQVGWCSSVEAARALWAWHVAGEESEAPDDFHVDGRSEGRSGPRAAWN